MEIESSVYGGQTSGGWICGPSATVRYGGAALGARVAERPRASPEAAGFLGAAAVAVEGQVNVPARGGGDPPDGDGRLPPDRVLGAAHARGGYEGRHTRIEVGAGAFQGWSSSSSREPIVVPYPELELAAGLMRSWEIVAGLGAPLVTSLHRPGAYLGAGLRLAPVEVVIRGGAYRRGPSPLGTVGSRFDLAAALPVPGQERLRLRAGVSMGADGDAGRLDGDGSLGALVAF
ncbi:MAG: hypothetical protein WKG00_30530 [Polyangiaceae bacterium]